MPRRLATSRAIVLLPDPAGPSMAMIIVPPTLRDRARSQDRTRRCSPHRRWWSPRWTPRPAMAPAMATRWSASVTMLPPAQPAGLAVDVHAVRVLHDLHAQGAQQRGHGPQPVALLGPQFGGSAQAGDAFRLGRRQQEQGQFVDDVGDLVGADVGGHQLRRARRDAPHGLGARRPGASRRPLRRPCARGPPAARCGWG